MVINIRCRSCMFTDRISVEGNAIASVRPSVLPFVRPIVSTLASEPTDR